MAGIDDLLRALPIDQVASKLGVDRDTATRAVQEGGTTILTGLERNAQTPSGSAAIEKALGRHTGGTENIDLDRVDTGDGQKILGHIFGGQEQQVAQRLSDEPQTAGIDFGKLLPMLAPVVMGLLAKQQSGSPASPQGAGGGIGDLIGGLLGGGAGRAGGAGGGFDIGGMLGGLLGGGRR